jgi:3-dehydroquinate dehydratase-2
MLGTRQPEIYGRETLADIEVLLRNRADQLGDVELDFAQSNHEGGMIDALQAHRDWDGIIINAGAYTHTSIAVADALAGLDIPAIEVHLSNVHRREAFRHQSYTAAVTWGQVVGFGFRSYIAALDLLYSRLSEGEPG